MSRGFARELAGGKAPVYLIHGEEAFITRRAMDWLRGAVLAGAVEDFNLDRFDGRENTDAERIVQAARTLPMMAARRLVWVRNAEALFKQSAGLDKLVEYVESPDPMSCLVFQAMERVKKNGKLYKRIAAHGCVLETKTPHERELVEWVRGAAEARERTLRPDAAAMLVEAIGRDLTALDIAVERLTLYVQARRPSSSSTSRPPCPTPGCARCGSSSTPSPIATWPARWSGPTNCSIKARSRCACSR